MQPDNNIGSKKYQLHALHTKLKMSVILCVHNIYAGIKVDRAKINFKTPKLWSLGLSCKLRKYDENVFAT